MRCYFIKNGHIVGVEELPGLLDHEAVARAHVLFAERKTPADAFEVWERTRVVVRHPEPATPIEGEEPFS
jgi:hypothetical protein